MILPGEPAPDARTLAVIVVSFVPLAVTVAASMKLLGEPFRPKLETYIFAVVSTVLRKLLLRTSVQLLACKSVRTWTSRRLRRSGASSPGLTSGSASGGFCTILSASRSDGSTFVPAIASSASRRTFLTRSRSVLSSRTYGTGFSFIRMTATSSPGLRLSTRLIAASFACSNRVVPRSTYPIEYELSSTITIEIAASGKTSVVSFF